MTRMRGNSLSICQINEQWNLITHTDSRTKKTFVELGQGDTEICMRVFNCFFVCFRKSVTQAKQDNAPLLATKGATILCSFRVYPQVQKLRKGFSCQLSLSCYHVITLEAVLNRMFYKCMISRKTKCRCSKACPADLILGA